jgi:hypothetical protein
MKEIKSFEEFTQKINERVRSHLDHDFMRFFDGEYYFKFVRGSLKGAIFHPHSDGRAITQSMDSDYVRGEYLDHPRFGYISDDAHEIRDLADNIIQGNVQVFRSGIDRDVTRVAQTEAEEYFEYLDEIEDY